ncbi:MAG: zinc ribbon domain-containing protein [bacterium]|nr:zinc ribbon domain-containing protein [bacterium]
MFGIDFGDAGGALTLVIVYGVMVIAAFWFAMILWTYRDMRARSRDPLAQLLVAVMVAVLTLPGLLIYIFLRPRETLSEAYERSLEEEALLQEIEEKPACPGCGQRVQASWQACPNCHTRLKKPCISCHQLLELSWNLCPYCATSQGYAADPIVTNYPAQAPTPEVRITRRQRTNARSPQGADSLEFIDGE